ncbi:protein regulator of cytokinesis 1-like [Anopheles bellator]|uniref:protein regulator of cytokinesis 1-like n=1 Tax=Anopheles bellator TaxID=139047 RepID=UPI002648D5A2|nr:protein regulator of cytokinesis 1-like [Anopheles bellator]
MEEDPNQHVLHKMQTICHSNFHRMVQLWCTMFDEHVCADYTQRLPEHMLAFFDEVYDESYQRKLRIEENIAKLKQEAYDLQRLLNEPAEHLIPEEIGVPLLILQKQLDCSLELMRSKLRERHEAIDDYLLEAETLCEELGEVPKELSKDPLPTEEQLEAYRSYLNQLIAEKQSRFEEIASLRRETKTWMADLEIIPQTESEKRLLNARKFPPTNANLAGLRLLHEETAAQYAELQRLIDEKHQQLERLWECLETDPATVRKFKKLTAYTQTTFDKLFAEHDRCETLRRQNMKAVIDRTRQEISVWWERCLKSIDERARFTTFKSDIYNEDTLALHEMELADLKEYYHANKAIFEMVTERQNMWNRMLALENKSNDPGRYNNRGGKLLEEERERRRISSLLPKVEAKLVDACRQYELEHGRMFTINGRSLREMIDDQWKQREENKHLHSSARKKANCAGVPGSAGRTPRAGESLVRAGSSTMLFSGSRSRLPSASTFGSTLKVPTTPLLSASKIRSVGGGSMMKRKMVATPTNVIHAKRSLLRQLNSPTVVGGGGLVVPKAPPGKLPAIKVYDTKVAGCVVQKRRSRRKSQTKRRSTNAKGGGPSASVSSTEGTILQDSVSYEKFETFFANNVPNRSSVVTRQAAAQQKHMLITVNGQPLTNCLEEEENLAPSPHNLAHPPIASSTNLGLSLRSPCAQSTSIASTTQSRSRRLKPALKNCPIIF